MKTMIINLVFIFLSTISIYGQTTSTVDVYMDTKTDYARMIESNPSFGYKQTREWKKFKRLRAYGWTALGVGRVMVCMGTIICSVGTGLTGNDVGAMIVFPCTGAALVATSIPMLTIAYKNRRKAKSFSFTTSSLSVDLPNGEKQTQPALGLCLNF